MPSLVSLLTLAHLLGMALGLGGATAKLALLLRARSDPSGLPVFLGASKPLTRLIILGLGLLVLSGGGWLLMGYPLRPILVVKLLLVGALGITGPLIDNVVEPRFREHAPEPGTAPSPEFLQAQRRFVQVEAAATGLFYVIVALWVLAG